MSFELGRNTARKLLCAIVAIAMIITAAMDASTSTSYAKAKSQKSWMDKTLKAYKAGNMKKARKYNKKLKKYAKEKCVSEMSEKQKKKYRAIVEKYSLDRLGSDPYLWDFYLTDYDNDKVADLIIKVGTCEADVLYRVYTYKSGKIKKLGKIGAAHSTLSSYPGKSGVVKMTGHMGNEECYKVYRKKGKTKQQKIGKTRMIEKYEDLFRLRSMLKSHVKYDEDYQAYIAWGELKD